MTGSSTASQALANEIVVRRFVDEVINNGDDSVYPYRENTPNQSLRYTFSDAREQVLVGEWRVDHPEDAPGVFF